MRSKLIRVVQNYDAVILVTKLSLYDFSVKSQYFSVHALYSVSTFHAFRLREPDFTELWSLNEKSWNFETLGTGSKGPSLSQYGATDFRRTSEEFLIIFSKV